MKLEHFISEYLMEIEVRKYTPKTIRGYRNGLSLFLRFCREKLGVDDIEDVSRCTIRKSSK